MLAWLMANGNSFGKSEREMRLWRFMSGNQNRTD